MKLQLNWQTQSQDYSSYPARGETPSFWTKLNDTWQTVLAYFATSSEPHVWRSQNGAGLVQWKAYDPATGQFVEYSSEEEMRIWLEDRHYQYPRFSR